MADKEERILHIVQKLDGRFVGENRISFQEAIERMAKALCRTYGEDCETCRFNGNEKGCKRYLEFRYYIIMAEAALNALLEDK